MHAEDVESSSGSVENHRRSDRATRDRTLRSREAALILHSRHDSRELTGSARDKFLARFQNEVDAGRVLTEGERTRRAELAKRGYFTPGTKIDGKSRQIGMNRVHVN